MQVGLSVASPGINGIQYRSRVRFRKGRGGSVVAHCLDLVGANFI